MVNYKRIAYDYFTVGGYSKVIQLGETPKTLYAPADPTTTGISYHDAEDGANYQVPTGKKFIIIGFLLRDSATDTNTIYQSDDVDASTNPVTKFVMVLKNSATIMEVAFPSETIILAEKYINQKTSSALPAPSFVLLYGIEVDA